MVWNFLLDVNIVDGPFLYAMYALAAAVFIYLLGRGPGWAWVLTVIVVLIVGALVGVGMLWVGVNVLGAENGLDAIEILKRNPDSDAVLMDIMMPGLDGYDTIRQVRSIPQFRKLPIIAVTARAMHGDREKCLEAGASDYIAKPVDVDALLDMLQSWCRT